MFDTNHHVRVFMGNENDGMGNDDDGMENEDDGMVHEDDGMVNEDDRMGNDDDRMGIMHYHIITYTRVLLTSLMNHTWEWYQLIHT